MFHFVKKYQYPLPGFRNRCFWQVGVGVPI